MLNDALRLASLFMVLTIVGFILAYAQDEIRWLWRRWKLAHPKRQQLGPSWSLAAKQAAIIGPIFFALLWLALAVTP